MEPYEADAGRKTAHLRGREGPVRGTTRIGEGEGGADAKAKATQTNRRCAGCLTVVGVLLILIFGTSSPLVAALTIVVGLIGLVLSAFGDLHQKAGNPKAARIALGVVAGLVLALGIYGIV
jgi:hypothetical protein